MSESRLKLYRKCVDLVDGLIIRLLRYRFKLSRKIGIEKSTLVLPRYSPDREKKINERIKNNVPERDLVLFVSKVYERIMDATRAFQKSSTDNGGRLPIKKALSKREWLLVIAFFFFVLSIVSLA